MDPFSTIHIAKTVPLRGRAKSFCGAILRRDVWFDDLHSVWRKTIQRSDINLVYKRYGKANKLFYYAEPYTANICKNCAESADYALAVLAGVP